MMREWVAALAGLALLVLPLGCAPAPAARADRASVALVPPVEAPITPRLAALRPSSPGQEIEAPVSMLASNQLLDGSVWTWGRNSRRGVAALRLPELVDPLPDTVAVATGLDQSLALTADGTVWAWPSPESAQETAGHGQPRSLPARVAELGSSVAIAAGDQHQLVLQRDGTVWAWGQNVHGQLGDGTRAARETPAPVRGLDRVVAIAAGTAYSLALRQDGTVWSWGSGALGRLGNGDVVDRGEPVAVGGLPEVTAMAAGPRHAVAVTRDGAVWTWGYHIVADPGETTLVLTVPILVEGISHAVAVAAGGTHRLALAADGQVWAWGDNAYGQLGNGTVDTHRPRPEPVPGLREVVAIAAGEDHSLALQADGTLWAWGSNMLGELGNSEGSPVFRTTPMRVAALNRVTSIAAAGGHSLAAQGAVARHLPAPAFRP